MHEFDFMQPGAEPERGKEMLKKTAFVLVVALLFTPLSPTAAMSWYSSPPGKYHNDYYDHHRSYYDYDDDHDDALLWAGGILLGTLLFTSMLQQPPALPPQQYIQPQHTQQVYSYPPNVPPGMCRWERYILDGYGRFVLDQYGQPIKEYTLGSCQYPPN